MCHSNQQSHFEIFMSKVEIENIIHVIRETVIVTFQNCVEDQNDSLVGVWNTLSCV